MARVWLVDDHADALSIESPAVNWANARVSDMVETTIGPGFYNDVRQRFELPPIVARFESGVSELQFNKVAVWIDDADFLHSIQVEDPRIIMPPDKYRTYLIYMAQDDGPNEAIPAYFECQATSFILWGGHSQWHKEYPEDSSVAQGAPFYMEGFASQWLKTFPPYTSVSTPGVFQTYGKQAELTYRRILQPLGGEAGSFAIDGGQTTFTYTHFSEIAANAGAFALEGQEADFLITGFFELNAAAGLFGLTGSEASFTILRSITEQGEAGSFLLTGQGAEFAHTIPEPPETVDIAKYESVTYNTGPQPSEYDEPGEMVFINNTLAYCNPKDSETNYIGDICPDVTEAPLLPCWVSNDQGATWAAYQLCISCSGSGPDDMGYAFAMEPAFSGDLIPMDGGTSSLWFSWTEKYVEPPPPPPEGPVVYAFDKVNQTAPSPAAADEIGECAMLGVNFMVNYLDIDQQDLRLSGFINETPGQSVWVRFDGGDWILKTFLLQDLPTAGLIYFNQGVDDMGAPNPCGLFEIAFEDPEA